MQVVCCYPSDGYRAAKEKKREGKGREGGGWKCGACESVMCRAQQLG
jgi:hypothetical protein